jgi:hypothetical protein
VRAIVVVPAAALACRAQQTKAERPIEVRQWKSVQALVERRLHEAPDAIFLWSQIGNAIGDPTSPLKLAERAVRLDPGVGRNHRQLPDVQGVMAQHAGVFQQIIRARRFRKENDAALPLDPRDTQALGDLLEFYLVAPEMVGGDTKKAEMVSQPIAAIDASEGFLGKARIAEFQKDRALTEAWLRRAAEARPSSYKTQMELARCYLLPEHRNEAPAETLSRTALNLDSGGSAAHSVLAAIYAGQKTWSALEAILSSALEAGPDNLAPYYWAAERLFADGHGLARARTERYLGAYLARETEGNQPSAADAHGKLGLALRARAQGANAGGSKGAN